MTPLNKVPARKGHPRAMQSPPFWRAAERSGHGHDIISGMEIAAWTPRPWDSFSRDCSPSPSSRRSSLGLRSELVAVWVFRM